MKEALLLVNTAVSRTHTETANWIWKKKKFEFEWTFFSSDLELVAPILFKAITICGSHKVRFKIRFPVCRW